MVPALHIKQSENLKGNFFLEITYEDRVLVCLKTFISNGCYSLLVIKIIKIVSGSVIVSRT